MTPTTKEYFHVPPPGQAVTMRLTRDLAESFISSDWAALHEDNPRIGREMHTIIDNGVSSIQVTIAGGELNSLAVDRVRVPGVKHTLRAVLADDVLFIRCSELADDQFSVEAAALNLDPLPNARSVR